MIPDTGQLVRQVEQKARGLDRAEQARDAAVVEAYAAGVGPTEIADAAGVTKPTVYRILRDAGTETTPAMDRIAARERGSR